MKILIKKEPKPDDMNIMGFRSESLSHMVLFLEEYEG